MRFTSSVVIPFVLVTLTRARPTKMSRSINPLEDAILFDSPAFESPDSPGDTSVSLQAFAFVRQLDLSPLSGALSSALSAIGIDGGDKIGTALDRIKLFAAIGLSGEEISADFSGCSGTAVLPETSSGLALNNVSLGQCDNAKDATGAVKMSLAGVDDRKIEGTMFFSPPDGFGVISDIDDTVKVSNVLDTAKAAQALLLDDPVPVNGMPELYASLVKSLNDPQFVYVTGSPFQLYPFLRDFIDKSYAASKGPILARNLTITDLGNLLSFLDSDGVFEFKSAMIDNTRGIYPKKKFLLVGDSTQKDPETYGEAFRKYGEDTITCAWIRRVDGADNTDERFATAFADVPKNKFRIYSDADIPSLQDIDVAGGDC